MSISLVQKYNVPGPRYTSYPTVPYWNENGFSVPGYIQALKASFQQTNSSRGVSLYLHLPFCESLCTFCGCNKRITKRHEVESPYIAALLEEWFLYTDLLEEPPMIREIHLGGGTPTFFAPENLRILIEGIFKRAIRSEQSEFSFEGHPNNTKQEHLEVLHGLGFRRVSYGVQDYNPVVQQAIHRFQPFVNVRDATEIARKIGYTSVSHDLIFGLPFQTLDHVKKTIEKTTLLMPDRIAFYSYAHVPWIKGNGQRGFKEEDLPGAPEKREMYETGKEMLRTAGYTEIGMDHFALPSDPLYQAMESGTLHRNFMGYSATKTKVMIGLGVSSISDCWTGFAQNVKNLEDYYELLERGELPLFRGHLLSREDQTIRQHILNLMCSFETSWSGSQLDFPERQMVLESLLEMEKDGLIRINGNSLRIPPEGRPFVRNVCMAFDLHLQRSPSDGRLFSMTI